MKKRKKGIYIFIAVVAILGVAVYMNWGKIRFAFDMISSYNKYEKEVKLEDQGKIDENFEEKNPLLEAMKKESDITDSTKDDENVNSNESQNSTGNSNGSGNNSSKNNTTTSKSEKYVSILSEHNNKFETLQKEYEGKLDSLVSQGKKEYAASGGKASVAKLANKYISLGNNLESECNGKFDKLVESMEKELKTNGYDTSIAKDLKQYYSSFKNFKMGELMEKGKKTME